MDILRYSALKEQNDVVSCRCYGINGIINTAGTQYNAVAQGAWFLWKDRINTFVCPAFWYQGIQTAPPGVCTTPGASNSICVVDTSIDYNAGATCTWTVPAGASFARFQLWGAGATQGNGGCCCGGSPYGETGAYASAVVPVTPGQVYNLRAGCAWYCFASGNACQNQGCCSCVCGPNGTFQMFAQGGISWLNCWLSCVQQACFSGYRVTGWNCPGSGGACLCQNCTDYCYSNSCATCGKMPFLYGIAEWGGTAPAGVTIMGIRSMYREFCFDTNHYGCQTHPPIYGFDTVTQCGLCWTSSRVHGCDYRAALNYNRYPGVGASATIAMGGCRPTGDMGRTGMVCVTWW